MGHSEEEGGVSSASVRNAYVGSEQGGLEVLFSLQIAALFNVFMYFRLCSSNLGLTREMNMCTHLRDLSAITVPNDQ